MPNNESQEIYFDTIIPQMKAGNAKQVFQKLSHHVSSLIGTSEKSLFDILMQNGALDNSGIGNGVAIAHAKIPRLTSAMVVYTKLDKPVNFNAIDDEPVDMVALILSPEYDVSKHLQHLAMVTRFFKDEEARSSLRSAKDYDGIRLAIKEVYNRKKAA